MEGYDTIGAPARAELVEKRSRFLAQARPIGSEEEMAVFLLDVKKEHRDARHHCWALVLRQGTLRYADDGEPQGTAGMPMLEVLRHSGLTDTAVVVTRYFGGTLLGTGGLARAYSQSAKLALEAAPVVRMRRCTLFMMEFDYSLYERMKLLAQRFGAVLLDTAFAADVTLTVRMEVGQYPAFAAELTQMTAGQVAPFVMGEEFAAV